MKFVNVSYIVREQNTIKKKWHKIGVCDDLTSIVQSFVNQLASSAIQSQRNEAADLTGHPVVTLTILSDLPQILICKYTHSAGFIVAVLAAEV